MKPLSGSKAEENKSTLPPILVIKVKE